jgi:hypothetical protein
MSPADRGVFMVPIIFFISLALQIGCPWLLKKFRKCEGMRLFESHGADNGRKKTISLRYDEVRKDLIVVSGTGT